MKIFMLGKPGAGKSTIGQHLAKVAGIDYVPTGDIMRQLAEDNEDIKKALDSGEYAPASLTDKFFLASFLEMGRETCVIDGYPRYIEQALDVAFYLARADNVAFVNVGAPDFKCLTAMTERARDSADPQRRLREHKDKTQPMIDYLRNRGFLIEVTNNHVDGQIPRLVEMIIDAINARRNLAPGLKKIIDA